MEELTLDFYGIRVNVRGERVLVERIRLDFSWFAGLASGGGERAAAVEIVAWNEPPPRGRVPVLRAGFHRADFVVYDDGPVRYVDYHGRALGIYDYGLERGELFAGDGDLLHELVYLLIHSRVGELLDLRGMHRVHALGIVSGGRGVLCLLPQGGGKTTLGMEMLGRNGVRLLSDDTPLVTVEGRLLPFPVRIGLCEHPEGIPERFLGRIVRRKYGKKHLIDIACFADRIAGPAVPRALLIGERESSNRPRIESLSRAAALVPLLKHCVVGLGLPQVAEYFLRLTPGDILRKTAIAWSRLRAAGRLLSVSDAYRFVLGGDPAENGRVLGVFLDALIAERPGKNNGRGWSRKKY